MMILDGRIPKGPVRPPLIPQLIIVDEAVGRIEVGIIPALGVVQGIPVTSAAAAAEIVLVLLFFLFLPCLFFRPVRNGLSETRFLPPSPAVRLSSASPRRPLGPIRMSSTTESDNAMQMRLRDRAELPSGTYRLGSESIRPMPMP